MSILLRPATLSDAIMLYEWRNDPLTRIQSLNSEPVDLPQHLVWIETVIKNPKQRLYVAEVDTIPIGTCRADFDGSQFRLSWTVAPNHRGKGFGLEMVRRLCQLHTPYIAEVKKENQASIKIAEALSMKRMSENDQLIIFSS